MTLKSQDMLCQKKIILRKVETQSSKSQSEILEKVLYLIGRCNRPANQAIKAIVTKIQTTTLRGAYT